MTKEVFRVATDMTVASMNKKSMILKIMFKRGNDLWNDTK